MATTSFARAAVTGSWALLILAALPHAQQPTFKSRVDLVTVDATVLDRDGRPVEGLSPDDFSLLVDGQPRRIASLQYVTYAAPPADAAVPAAAPAASVQHLDGRVLLIAVDQANIRRVEDQLQKMQARSSVLASAADGPVGIPEDFNEHMTVTYDLLHIAFQGDISRVFSFMLGHEGSG